MIWQPEVFQVCKSGYNQPLAAKIKINLITRNVKLKNIILSSITITFLFIFSSCANKAPLLKENPNCKSTIEGYYHCYGKWTGKAPVLFKKKGRKTIPIPGKILEQTDEGFLFDPDPSGPMFDGDPKFFPNEKIVAVLDSSYNTIFGELSERYKKTWELLLFVKNIDNKKSKEILLELKQNEHFGFCLEPGTYEIVRIQFRNLKGKIDEGLEIPTLSFHIEENSVNYIGDLYLNFLDKRDNLIYLSYKNVYDPGGAAFAGFMGGAIGGAIYGAYKAAKGAEGIHRFSIENNNEFSSSFKLQKKTHLINVK